MLTAALMGLGLEQLELYFTFYFPFYRLMQLAFYIRGSKETNFKIYLCIHLVFSEDQVIYYIEANTPVEQFSDF